MLDLLNGWAVANVALSQLSYGPGFVGEYMRRLSVAVKGVGVALDSMIRSNNPALNKFHLTAV